MFCTQENQFVSPAVPSTLEKLNEILDSPRTKWKIETIRAVRKPEAIKLWASNTEFQKSHDFGVRKFQVLARSWTSKTTSNEVKIS